jgi:hypothetical protein
MARRRLRWTLFDICPVSDTFALDMRFIIGFLPKRAREFLISAGMAQLM